jgi:hypothetical protein
VTRERVRQLLLELGLRPTAYPRRYGLGERRQRLMDRVTQVATVMIALGVWATLGWLVLTR